MFISHGGNVGKVSKILIKLDYLVYREFGDLGLILGKIGPRVGFVDD